MEAIALRGLERILGVLIGGLSVYLGYRLFLSLPEQTNSEGRFILPGNISIYLSRVGPGVFFALFGAGVVIASLYFSLTIRPAEKRHTDSPETGGVFFSYLGGGATLEESRSHVRGDISVLNSLSSYLKPDLDDTTRGDIELAIPRIKLAVMLTVWDRDWGDYAEFKKWVEGGAVGRPPNELEEPAQYYRHGHRGEKE